MVLFIDCLSCNLRNFAPQTPLFLNTLIKVNLELNPFYTTLSWLWYKPCYKYAILWYSITEWRWKMSQNCEKKCSLYFRCKIWLILCTIKGSKNSDTKKLWSNLLLIKNFVKMQPLNCDLFLSHNTRQYSHALHIFNNTVKDPFYKRGKCWMGW